MIRLITLITIACLAIGNARAQDNAINTFFKKYDQDENFTRVSITSKMFGLFTDLEIEDPEDQEVLDAISKLKGLNILSREKISNGKALYREALSLLPKGAFEELMVVRDQDHDLKFLIQEENGKISELLMVSGSNDGFFILSLVGEVDLKQVSRISKKMNIDGLEDLDKLDEKSPKN